MVACNLLAMMDDSLHGDGAAHKKDVSLAVWLWDEGMAEVIAKKGQMWGTTGITRSGRLLCHVEEAVFLVDRGSLVVMDGEEVMPAATVYNLLTDSRYGCSWGAYQCYAYLKKLGYVVGRHGVAYSDKAKGRNGGEGQMQQSGNFAVFTAADTRAGDESAELRLMYDVHLPNSRFRKTAPGVPAFSLCVTSGCPPGRAEVRRLQEENQGVPVKFASCDGGHVSICSFDEIELEFLP